MVIIDSCDLCLRLSIQSERENDSLGHIEKSVAQHHNFYQYNTHYIRIVRVSWIILSLNLGLFIIVNKSFNTFTLSLVVIVFVTWQIISNKKILGHMVFSVSSYLYFIQKFFGRWAHLYCLTTFVAPLQLDHCILTAYLLFLLKACLALNDEKLGFL